MEDLESLQKYWNAQYEETINSQTQLYIAICDDKENKNFDPHNRNDSDGNRIFYDERCSDRAADFSNRMDLSYFIFGIQSWNSK